MKCKHTGDTHRILEQDKGIMRWTEYLRYFRSLPELSGSLERKEYVSYEIRFKKNYAECLEELQKV